MKLSIKNLAIVGAVIAAIAGGIWLAKPSEASVCDGWINVITCGTPSHQDLKNVYYGRNDIKALYQWNNINDAMIEGKGMKNGTVYKDGRIVVDGQVVATNAKTVQRNTRYPGSSYGRETVGGHSFYKFTTQNSFVYNQFDAFVWFDENGKFIAAITRIVGAAIEQCHDERGCIFPAAIAPFTVCIVPMGYAKSETVRTAADALYADLQAAGIDVLLDDRNERPGVLFADMELIGIPHRVVIGERVLKEGLFEYQGRRDTEAKMVPAREIIAFLKARLCTA